MCSNRIFLVVCLIVYACFQFYQTYSSVKYVFFDYKDYYDRKTQTQLFAGFHAVGFVTSSLLLLFGALKSNIKCLIGAFCFLVYKLSFNFWYMSDAFKMTIGCEGTGCDPQRLWIIYKHVFIFREFCLKFVKVCSKRNFLSKNLNF